MWSNQTSSTAVSWSQTDWIDEGILKTPISLVFPRALQSAVCCQRLVVINRLAWKAHGVLTNPWRQSLWARLKPICKWPTESDLQNKACMLLDRQGHNSHHDRKCALNDRLEMVPLILINQFGDGDKFDGTTLCTWKKANETNQIWFSSSFSAPMPHISVYRKQHHRIQHTDNSSGMSLSTLHRSGQESLVLHFICLVPVWPFIDPLIYHPWPASWNKLERKVSHSLTNLTKTAKLQWTRGFLALQMRTSNASRNGPGIVALQVWRFYPLQFLTGPAVTMVRTSVTNTRRCCALCSKCSKCS